LAPTLRKTAGKMPALPIATTSTTCAIANLNGFLRHSRGVHRASFFFPIQRFRTPKRVHRSYQGGESQKDNRK
jgi:hypothetical protein